MLPTTDSPDRPLVLQRPEHPAQLILLFHGVGASPADLAPLGEHLATRFEQALIVSLPGSEDCEFSSGRQWFSVRDVTDDNRPARVAQAMPAFVDVVRHWQRESGLGTEATALVGFSQGAIMALASSQRGEPTLAGRIVGIAGRFPEPPTQAAEDTTFHLFHGKHDPVISYGQTVMAAERLVALGADITADVIPFLGHEISQDLLDLLIERLTTHVPKRVWEAAMRAAPDEGASH